jgi:hypothetical protein
LQLFRLIDLGFDLHDLFFESKDVDDYFFCKVELPLYICFTNFFISFIYEEVLLLDSISFILLRIAVEELLADLDGLKINIILYLSVSEEGFLVARVLEMDVADIVLDDPDAGIVADGEVEHLRSGVDEQCFRIIAAHEGIVRRL